MCRWRRPTEPHAISNVTVHRTTDRTPYATIAILMSHVTRTVTFTKFLVSVDSWSNTGTSHRLQNPVVSELTRILKLKAYQQQFVDLHRNALRSVETYEQFVSVQPVQQWSSAGAVGRVTRTHTTDHTNSVNEVKSQFDVGATVWFLLLTRLWQ